MLKWQAFENNATQFLNDYFGNETTSFKNLGASDSTIEDIQVIQNGSKISAIEAKFSPSQSGQIVVLMQDEKFIFSEDSQNRSNPYTPMILDHINANFKTFESVGSRGFNLDISKEVLFNWVIDTYKNKGVSWLISSASYENLNPKNLLLVPLNEIPDYFTITAKLRRKKSGTAHLPKSAKDDFIADLKEQIGSDRFDIKPLGKKFLLKSEVAIENRNIGEAYFLTPTEIENQFLIKKKSKTNNPNIVFSLKLKGVQFKEDAFKEYFDL